MRILFYLLLLSSSHYAIAASVDTVLIRSEAMDKAFKAVVIKPDTYKKNKQGFPVVYLLHGYDGDYSNWIKRVPEIKNLSDKYQVIIVCPDGHVSSWYFDSPIDSTMKYETYIGKEVPMFIDKHYKTIKDRRARAITGLSMGGHGALFIAWRNANSFGATGSMSGVADINFRRKSYELSQRIGDTLQYAQNWKDYSVINVVEKKPTDSLAVIIDCGIKDVFINVNRELHSKLMILKIPHDYSEKPGNHSWDYWKNSIEYHLLFFSKYFDNMPVADKKSKIK